MHCWFWRVEMVSTSLSPAVRFLSSLKCDLPCDWFTPTMSQIAVHFRALMHHLFCLRAFLNTAQVCCPPFCHTHNIQLINNGQAANNRRPKLRHFTMLWRLMTRCRVHAVTAKNMPASRTFNIQFLRVQQQEGVYRLPVFPRGDVSNSDGLILKQVVTMQQAGQYTKAIFSAGPSSSVDVALLLTTPRHFKFSILCWHFGTFSNLLGFIFCTQLRSSS